MKFLRDLWNEQDAAAFGNDPLELLRYRSNLLGADQRITNYGGGNTSGKFEIPDPVTGAPVRVLAVKGSGGDLGTMASAGFALLDLGRLLQLREVYKGEAHEDGMVAHYPRFSVANHGVAPSIDTPLHAFLPFNHVDHLHPDWAIALAASANGRAKLDEFNRRFARKLIWLPWQRPGFELAMMLRQRSRPASRRGRHHPGEPRPLHVGRDVAGVLPEHVGHHRRPRYVRPGTPGSDRPLRRPAHRRARGPP